jgi:hypothetical protein
MRKISGWVFGFLPVLFFLQFRNAVFGFFLPPLQISFGKMGDIPRPTRFILEHASGISASIWVVAAAIGLVALWLNLKVEGERKWVLLNALQMVSYLVLIEIGCGILLALTLPLFANLPK